MTITSGTEILGLIADVVGPVTASYLQLPKGVTVLYGLNGAGKTRLLRAIKDSLVGGGSRDDCALVVRSRYNGEDPDRAPRLEREYASGWANQEELIWTPASVLPEFHVALDVPFNRAVMASLESESDFLESTTSGPAIDANALCDEFVSQRVFLISPMAHEGHEVQLGGIASDDAPMIDQLVSKFRNAKGGSDAGLSEASSFFDPFQGDRVFDQKRLPVVALSDSGRWMRDLSVATVVTDPERGDVPDARHIIRQLKFRDGKAVNKQGLSEDARLIVAALGELTQSLFDQVLMDAPKLELHIGKPREWLMGDAPVWRVAGSGGRLSVNDLSRAQKRWALTSISVASQVIERQLQPGRSRVTEVTPLVVLLDEPEAALHRSAERWMAHGLMAWAKALDAHIIVASHSPELLDVPDANLIHVGTSPSDSTNSAQPLLAPSLQSMSKFGLAPSDLLRRQRGFLLVEGTHDQIVLEVLIGDELRTARVEILPLRGAKQLPSTVDSQFLFDYTDAHVIVMLDATDAASVRLVWAEAQVISATSGSGLAGEYLRAELKGNGAEMRWMQEFMSRALVREVESRIFPFGLASPDVIDYLPVNRFVKSASSWEGLRAQHRTGGGGKPFKGWLAAAYGASFATEDIRAAAESLDTVPDEIVELANLCRGLSADRSGRHKPALSRTWL